MKIHLETTDLATIKKKMEAYSILFDTTPILWIQGYFEDKLGEMVHFRSKGKALAVGRKWIMADVDGKLESIKPTDAQFSINGIGDK